MARKAMIPPQGSANGPDPTWSAPGSVLPAGWSPGGAAGVAQIAGIAELVEPRSELPAPALRALLVQVLLVEELVRAVGAAELVLDRHVEPLGEGHGVRGDAVDGREVQAARLEGRS